LSDASDAIDRSSDWSVATLAVSVITIHESGDWVVCEGTAESCPTSGHTLKQFLMQIRERAVSFGRDLWRVWGRIHNTQNGVAELT
jgi:hypothetical protein